METTPEQVAPASDALDGGPQPNPTGPLRIARFERRSSVLGPGLRTVVWFQGCSLTCRGCIAASMNASPPMLRTTARELADWIMADPSDGFTLSGGDPFDQPLDALADLLETVRRESALSAMVYTGRTLAQLQAAEDPCASRCLRAIDVLIDGPYVEELNDGIGWRGSSNQVLHVLGQRASGFADGASVQRRLELRVSADGTVSFTGMPARGRGRDIARSLETAADATMRSQGARQEESK